MSTGCLVPLAPMTTPVSQYSNFIICIFCNSYKARESTDKDCCFCCCSKRVAKGFCVTRDRPKISSVTESKLAA